MGPTAPTVHVAIPVQDEAAYLPACIDALRQQEGVQFVTWCCVNQPDAWHHDLDRRSICKANANCLEFLHGIQDIDLRVLDRTSPGRGWAPKRGGIGYARKELMDAIGRTAATHDIIVSLDADTITPPGYLASIVLAFARHPAASGLAVRYFHPLVEDEEVTRAMLGYEIYMRYYVLNMWRIGSPYSFTALGSAIAFPVHVYHKIGGLTPKTGGEDFYLLQKLVKHGRVIHWSDEVVSPATRKSRRVPVGTGPAIVAACEGEHRDRYPLYSPELFDRIHRTTEAFPSLFERDVPTPLEEFLRDKTGTQDPWQPLRDNHTTPDRFVRACHERLDGLRILQYLKTEFRRAPTDDGDTLIGWLDRYGRVLPGTENEVSHWLTVLQGRTIADLTISELDGLRRMLFSMEDRYRREDFLRG